MSGESPTDGRARSALAGATGRRVSDDGHDGGAAGRVSGTPGTRETHGSATPRSPFASFAMALAGAEIGALFALAAVAALGIGLIMWALRPGWAPVVEGGGRSGSLAVIELLASSGIEHRLDPKSGLVLVPESRLGEVRAHVAAAGLDGDDGIGFEMLSDEPAMGTSQFTETRRYQHAIEIELARTIAGMRGIDSARVHLAMPNRSVFVRDREAASASVMVQSHAGRNLDEEQVDAIRRLVAAGIPYLEVGDVTVVDRLGRLLSDDGDRGASREHYGQARRLERLYTERIESLLTPLIGAGAVRATVTADVDFSVEEQTAETFEPDNAQLRSEQREDMRESNAASAGGVPGSLVNQPPAGGVVGGVADTDAAGAVAEEGTVSSSASSVRNYELDRTITHVRRSPGTIRRVSAAVVVDYRTAVGADGESERTPLDADEIEQLTALVREAIGFDAARGDSVVVANREFLPSVPLAALPELSLWEQPWIGSLVREAAIGLAVLLLVWTGVRPALQRLLGRRAAQPALAELDAPAEVAARTGQSATATHIGRQSAVHGDILATARALAADDPKRVARLVKDWVGDAR